MSLVPLSNILPALVSIFAAMALTGVVRRRAVAHSLLDYPNERSSHVTPTPRGGGLAVVCVVLVYLLWAGISDRLPASTVVGLAGGGALVAAAGWLDDLRSLGLRSRLAIHFVAAVWTLSWLGGFHSLIVGATTISLGPVGVILGVLGLIWATNLFNFMDGIDGIASVEAVSVGAVGGFFLLSGGSPGLGELALVIAGSMLGFVGWNWAPAKIFLGDVGSGFLGFIFAGIAIAAENQRAVPIFVWAILAAVFIVDATVTLVRRLKKGLWRRPHRTHAYQRAVQAGWTHSRVAGVVGALNLVLAGLAGAAMAGFISIPIALFAALMLTGAAYAAVEVRQPLDLDTRSVSLAE